MPYKKWLVKSVFDEIFFCKGKITSSSKLNFLLREHIDFDEHFLVKFPEMGKREILLQNKQYTGDEDMWLNNVEQELESSTFLISALTIRPLTIQQLYLSYTINFKMSKSSHNIIIFWLVILSELELISQV